MTSSLDSLRRGIDQLTRELVATLEKRAVVASNIAELKRREGLPARDRLREERLLEATLADMGGVLSKRSLLAILHEVIDVGLAQRGVGSERALGIVHAAPKQPMLGTGRVIAGPRVVEDEAQIEAVATCLASCGVNVLTAGSFRAGVSPYAFEGLGLPGVELLARAAHRHGMRCVTEVIDVRHVAAVAERVDMLRVGASSMRDVPLLREVAQAGRPVILERGHGADAHEWLCAAEQIARAGEANIVLAERSEPGAVLDLSRLADLETETDLPMIVDVGHAAGRRELIAPLARAALAVGADAVSVSVHPDPDVARVDAASHLDFDAFAALLRDLPRSFHALARELEAAPRSAITTPPLHAIQAERNAS